MEDSCLDISTLSGQALCCLFNIIVVKRTRFYTLNEFNEYYVQLLNVK